MWRITFTRKVEETNPETGEALIKEITETAECRNKTNFDECMFTLQNYYRCKDISVEEIAEGDNDG